MSQTTATQWPTITLAEVTATPGTILPAPDAELTESIRAQGITDPLHITYTSTGAPQIIDGRRRAAAAQAAGLDTLPYSTRPMIRVDALNAHPHNARDKATAPRDMVESVRLEGVLIPLKIDGTRIIDGHIRLDAARRTGRTHVPYEQDTRDEASQYLDMVTTARHRHGLSQGEEAGALFRATEAGASIQRAARAAGLTQKDAKKAIKGGRSKTATRVASAYTLTLDQMAALADLAEQAPEAAKKVEAEAAKRPHDIRYIIARAITEQAAKAKAAAHRVKLENSGAKFKEFDDLSDRAQRLEGKDATVHARKCKGHVWVLEHETDEQHTPYCANVVLYEHTTTQTTSEKGQQTAEAVKAKEAERAARRAVKSGNLDWDAATEMRRQWLTEFFSARTTPATKVEAVQRVTARILMTGYLAADRLSAHGLPEILAEFIGADAARLQSHADRERTAAKASPKRAAILSLAILIAGFEAKMRRDAWRTDSQRNEDQRQAAARLLGWLTDLGYQPTEIETAVRDDKPYEPESQPKAETSQNVTEEAANEVPGQATIEQAPDSADEDKQAPESADEDEPGGEDAEPSKAPEPVDAPAAAEGDHHTP
jgi:ParB family transcriptional regulator, chromosome partitioning protein